MKRTYIAAALVASAVAAPVMAADYIYYYPAGTTVVPSHVYVVPSDPTLLTVQQRLRDIGYKDVRVNGVMEDRTIEAVKMFQKEEGYPATGALDQRTLALLRVNLGGSGSVGGVPVIVTSETPIVVSPRVEPLPSQYYYPPQSERIHWNY